MTIEKGSFMPKPWIGREGGFRHQYGLRLLFDRSPYPTREGLRAPDEPPVSGFRFEEMDLFVARALTQLDAKGTAMDRDSSASVGTWMASLFRW